MLRGKRVAKQLCHLIVVDLKTKTLFRRETVVFGRPPEDVFPVPRVCAILSGGVVA